VTRASRSTAVMLVTNITAMSPSEATRSRIQEEAIRLFSERGFDEVTVEEVAQAAGVSHMTFFRYFPTKQSVVLDDPYDPLIGAAVAAQDPTLPALERVRRGLLATWDEVDAPGDAMTRRRIVLAASHRALRAGVWENNLRTEDIVVEALTSTGASELEARVAAGAVNGALTAALFHWAEDPETGSLGDRVRSALDQLHVATDSAEASA
jgi:AcrR family transcriptional regulator